jgi:phosphate/sulfate permease
MGVIVPVSITVTMVFDFTNGFHGTANTMATSIPTGGAEPKVAVAIISLAPVTAETLPAGSAPPLWVVLMTGLAIVLGTYLGGWRIIRIIGKRIADGRTREALAGVAAGRFGYFVGWTESVGPMRCGHTVSTAWSANSLS